MMEICIPMRRILIIVVGRPLAAQKKEAGANPKTAAVRLKR